MSKNILKKLLKELERNYENIQQDTIDNKFVIQLLWNVLYHLFYYKYINIKKKITLDTLYEEYTYILNIINWMKQISTLNDIKARFKLEIETIQDIIKKCFSEDIEENNWCADVTIMFIVEFIMYKLSNIKPQNDYNLYQQ